jgi:hypothetical protein
MNVSFHSFFSSPPALFAGIFVAKVILENMKFEQRKIQGKWKMEKILGNKVMLFMTIY